MKSTPQCYTPAEAAKVLRIGRTKLYALIKVNQIPHVRVGHRILIPVKELETWLHEQTRK